MDNWVPIIQNNQEDFDKWKSLYQKRVEKMASPVQLMSVFPAQGEM